MIQLTIFGVIVLVVSPSWQQFTQNADNEYLFVSLSTNISRINLVSDEIDLIVIPDLLTATALEYDITSKCLFYADARNDIIGRMCTAANESQTVEILANTNVSSVEGLAYDWVSGLLYFTDGDNHMIEVIKTVHFDASMKHFFRQSVIDTGEASKIRGIAVNPMAGFLFWSDWQTDTPSISRARLDGGDVFALFQRPKVYWPNGITIDYEAERIYWIDARLDYIGRSDFDGNLFEEVIKDDRIKHPFGIAVHGDFLYWNDWTASAVFRANKGKYTYHIIAIIVQKILY